MNQLESQKTVLENLLSTNLNKRKSELEEQLELLHLGEEAVELQQKEKELATIRTDIDDSASRSKGISFASTMSYCFPRNNKGNR